MQHKEVSSEKSHNTQSLGAYMNTQKALPQMWQKIYKYN